MAFFVPDPLLASALTDLFLALLVLYLWATGQGYRWLLLLVPGTLAAVALASFEGWGDLLPWLGGVLVDSLVAIAAGWVLEELFPRQVSAKPTAPPSPLPPKPTGPG